jgi:antitoxin CptB
MSEEIARLRYQCRRGMLELDIILQTFFESYFQHLTSSEQADFEKLLRYTDQELYNWFIGNLEPMDEKLQALIKTIRLTRKSSSFRLVNDDST